MASTSQSIRFFYEVIHCASVKLNGPQYMLFQYWLPKSQGHFTRNYYIISVNLYVKFLIRWKGIDKGELPMMSRLVGGPEFLHFTCLGSAGKWPRKLWADFGFCLFTQLKMCSPFFKWPSFWRNKKTFGISSLSGDRKELLI